MSGISISIGLSQDLIGSVTEGSPPDAVRLLPDGPAFIQTLAGGDVSCAPNADPWGAAPYILSTNTVAALTSQGALLSPGLVTSDTDLGATLSYLPAFWAYDTAGAIAVSDLQWFADGTPIAGAFGTTFVITPAQQGRDITVTETLSQAGHLDSITTSNAISVPSAPLLPHAAPAAPSLSGTPVIGGQMTLTPGAAGSADEAEYRWYLDDAVLSGVTGLNYTVTVEGALYAEQRNREFGVTEWSDWVPSSTVTLTYPAPTAASGLVDLSFEIGSGPQTVDAASDFTNASNGTWSVTGPDASIDTAGLVTLALGNEMSASTVHITYTNSGGTASSAFSLTVTNPLAFNVTGPDEVEVVLAENGDVLISPSPDEWGNAPYLLTATQADEIQNAPHLLHPGIIHGMLIEGEILSYTPAFWASDSDGPEFIRTYQWHSNGVPISGATDLNLMITAALAVTTITVNETGTQAGYLPVTQTSNTLGFFAAQADSIVLIGASFMERTAGQNLNTVSVEATPVFQAAGVNLPVYGYGFSGEDTNDLRARVDAAASAHPNALMIVHIGGNDVSDTRPYVSRSQAEVDAYDAAVDALIATCQQYGERVQWGSLSFRDYDGNLATFIEPNNGTRPYNEGVLLPKLTTGLPHCVTPHGRPHYDFYRNGLLDFENLLDVDNVHPKDPEGELAWLTYIAEVTADMINGVARPQIPERIYVPSPSVGGYFLNFGDSVSELGVTSFDDLALLNTALPLVGSDGSLSPYTATVNSNGVAGTFDNFGLGFNFDGRVSGGSGFDRSGLYFDIFTVASLYGGQDVVNTVQLDGFDPGQAVDISAVASRITGITRETQITDGTTSLTFHATANPVTAPTSARFTADAQGRVTLSVSPSLGTFSYIGALQIEPVAT